MEEDVELRRGEELLCPHCGLGDLRVTGVHIHHPTDEMTFTFNTEPPGLRDIDGGGGYEYDGSLVPGYVTLILDCEQCSPRGAGLYLHITDGKTHVEGGEGVVRVHWDTDDPDDPDDQPPEPERPLSAERIEQIADFRKKLASRDRNK